MSEKKASGWINTIKDMRVLLVIVLVIIALAAIFVPIGDRGDAMTNLQFGLDLDGGSWIQLEFQAEVVTIGAGADVNDVAEKMGEYLDCTVTPIDQYHLEVQKDATEEELRAAVAAAGASFIGYENGVGSTTAETVKRILESKVNSLGTNDVKVNTLTNTNGG
ncbi:MAG TPA: preprotein translocase subunit SecD, partial [Methanocorpusculum sp.]|nr:preprotein translocase subunit SecD [Methanocorpusculum sp.]